jgi:hypothetical protein
VEPAEVSTASEPEPQPILQRDLDKTAASPRPSIETPPAERKPTDIDQTVEPKLAEGEITAETSFEERIAQPPETPPDAPEEHPKPAQEEEAEQSLPADESVEGLQQAAQPPQIARQLDSQLPKAAPKLEPASIPESEHEPPTQQEVPEPGAEPQIEAEPPAEIDPDDAETLIQPVPLEAAWPVQEVKLPKADQTPEQPAEPSEATVQRTPKGIDKEGEEVHASIKDVAPEKPTDSSIELLTPRRPRPTSKVEPTSTVEEQQPSAERPQEPPTDPPEIESPSETIQKPEPVHRPGDAPTASIQKAPDLTMPEEPPPPATRPEKAETPSKPEAGLLDEGPSDAPHETPPVAEMPPAGEVPRTKPAAVMPTLQREAATLPEAAAPTTKAAEPYMVPTEIGDLPSDLWTLLGEKPPPPVARETPAPASATEGAVQRKTNGQPVKMLTEVFRTPEIQRADETPRVPATAAEQAAEEADKGDDEQSTEVDLDALARDVYSEIKRRLQIDWERGRFR